MAHPTSAYRLARENARQLRGRVASEARARTHALRRAARARKRELEDAADLTRLTVRRHPWRSLSIAFAAGSLLGVMGAAAYAMRKRP